MDFIKRILQIMVTSFTSMCLGTPITQTKQFAQTLGTASADPIIFVNGLYNMQFSPRVGEDGGGCLRLKYLFHLLPLMSAEMNAEYLYNRIMGGSVIIGRYKEDADGIYPVWSEAKPIRIVAISYGCDVVVELIKILEAKGLQPDRMISGGVLMNPHFASAKSNYVSWQYFLAVAYICFSKMANVLPYLRRFYDPRDTVLTKIKITQGQEFGRDEKLWDIAACQRLCSALPNYKLDGRFPFRLWQKKKNTNTPIDERWHVLKESAVRLQIVVGAFYESNYNFLWTITRTLFWWISLIYMQMTIGQTTVKTYSNVVPFEHIFDGMCLYDYETCRKLGIDVAA